MRKNRKPIILYILILLISTLAATIVALCSFGKRNFNVKLNEIVKTLEGPLEGADSNLINLGLMQCLPIIIGVIILVIVLFIIDLRLYKKKNMLPVRIAIFCSSIVFLAASLWYIDSSYGVINYIKARTTESTLYEEYYVETSDVNVTANGKTKNIVLVYLESMETSYASKEKGGLLDYNLIPNLVKYAKNNISFSNTDKLGGFYSNYGTTWTMGALFATTTGIPYDLPIDENVMYDKGLYATGVTSFGDILKEKGYTNEFLCGSASEFAGRRMYFETHGDYEIYDFHTAAEKGTIPPGFAVWWGFNDVKLYDIAEMELTRLYEEGKPFNLTLITCDTHMPDGLICDQCDPDEYPDVAANVVKCADKLLKKFLKWCEKQPFYEDTVFVLCGDHPRMDKPLVGDKNWYDRTLYNCFINADADNSANARTKYRETAPMDMFPTMLSAMGFDIEGDKLGLGTNLFSDKETLTEKLGIAAYDTELEKKSDYYLKHFAPELVEE